jgi:hypothetical protein
VLFPAPVQPEPPPVLALQRPVLRLVRDERPRPASGMRLALADLAHWAETAPSAEIGALRAARLGDQVLLLGPRLPTVGGGQRLWGERLLVPLGFVPEPALPESALLEVLAVDGDALAVLDASGAEIVPRGVFQPLTRAGIRLAARGAS